ncbi:NB-ARC domain-containing protein [Micromonospora sp. MW-13]|uniref:NB-ARC domain-containing protein n=1 Tax=Micromonospora sp. MW-13 TaxID=2094022 RepID=UPI001A9FFE46|nr:NB-ARC domain-containing protein [Micromonospora sp. MW-13]
MPAGPLTDFYERLHDLHVAAGQPSVRRLQRLTRTGRWPTGINPTSIHAAFVRPRLARWEVVREIVRALGGDVDEFTGLWCRAHRCQARDDVGPVDPAPQDRAWAPAAHVPVPRELPPDVLPFTGRGLLRGALDALLAEAANRAAMMTVLLTGAAGIGKTALAVHWAHRVAGCFPDGQLYVDLRGDGSGQPPSPTEVLAAFLNALGVASTELPGTAAALAACYRTRMSGRRTLVLLDNASSVEQVRPLLPGSPGCLVLVTSRENLAELVVRHGARRLELGPLSTEAAVELLRGLLGDRVDAEPEAVYDLVRRCAARPLALRAAAERAAARGTLVLAATDRTAAEPAWGGAGAERGRPPRLRGPTDPARSTGVTAPALLSRVRPPGAGPPARRPEQAQLSAG